MCGIFGYLNYGNVVKDKDLKDILKSLSYESVTRGLDATGIAFVNSKNNIEIHKAPKAAYSFKMNLPDTMPLAVIGHTRHTTQGSEKLNINNHPFQGKAGNTYFALAHNGILYNDCDLRLEYGLPNPKIQTDSYVAVQLLEREKRLNIAALKNMAEAVCGSFCFAVLDNSNNLYIIKGDNPISIVHNKRLKLYLYASTEKILASGIVRSDLYAHFLPTKKNAGGLEIINLEDGEIVKIDAKGKVSKETFKKPQMQEWHNSYYDWPFLGRHSPSVAIDIFNPALDVRDFLNNPNPIEYSFNYKEELQNIAKTMGYEEEIIQDLLDEGFTFEEIEEYLYEDSCF